MILGTYAEFAGDLGAVAEEFLKGEHLYSHEAHWKGASLGMALGFAFDKLRGHGRLKYHKYWLFPLITIAALIGKDAVRDGDGRRRLAGERLLVV